jgi:hypothetical protein
MARTLVVLPRALSVVLLVLLPNARATGQRPVAIAAPATAPRAEGEGITAASVLRQPPPLPDAIASFGACRTEGHVYVYGGHVGRRHAHSRANVVGAFHRLALDGGTAWQPLPAGPALQGTALVAAPDGSVVRVGGMTARNEPGADADLWSTASVARFDPAHGTWTELTPLPEPRSSHDAAVVDGRVYVVGGWQLAGGEHGTWHTTAWVADLRFEPLAWQPIAAPRPRRAVALAAFGSGVALLGGLAPDGMVARVERFDPVTGAWREGPPLPDGAFGTAAVALGGELLATVADGRLLAWNGGATWRPTGQLVLPRFFHRLLPGLDGHVLALGGAARAGHVRACELVATRPAPEPAVQEITIAAPGRVAHRQALLLHGDTLLAFGGNRGGGGDRFAAAQLADDVWRVDLGHHRAERIATMPAAGQSLVAVATGTRGDAVLLGGLATGAGGAVAATGAAWRWDAASRTLQPFVPLPQPRTQHQAFVHGGRLWVLGGVDFRPDDGGGDARGDAASVFACALDADEPAFTLADVRLPRPRRSFGAALLGERLVLLGGLRDGFAPAGPGDVLDLATGTWSELALPVAWVSPQVARVGERLYVACGGTMQGQRFTEDRALWSWCEREGWRRVVDALPFAVRLVQMLAWRDRLLFVANDPAKGQLVLRVLAPDPAALSREDAMHR